MPLKLEPYPQNLYIIYSFMMLIPHTFVGIALATSIPNPTIAAPISFLMHFLGDRVPHWDFYAFTTKDQKTTGWRPIGVMADMAIGIGVSLAFTFYALWVKNDSALALNIFLCALASVLPDVLTAPAIYYKNKNMGFFSWIKAIQSKMQFQEHAPWGLVTQLIVILVSCLVIFLKI